MNICIYSADDWQVVTINEKKVFAGHSVQPVTLLRTLQAWQKNNPADTIIESVDTTWIDIDPYTMEVSLDGDVIELDIDTFEYL